MGIARKQEEQIVEVATYVCDRCATEHHEAELVRVIPWELSPRTVTEDEETRPVVTEAVAGDPLVLCRGGCVRALAEQLRGAS